MQSSLSFKKLPFSSAMSFFWFFLHPCYITFLLLLFLLFHALFLWLHFIYNNAQATLNLHCMQNMQNGTGEWRIKFCKIAIVSTLSYLFTTSWTVRSATTVRLSTIFNNYATLNISFSMTYTQRDFNNYQEDAYFTLVSPSIC